MKEDEEETDQECFPESNNSLDSLLVIDAIGGVDGELL